MALTISAERLERLRALCLAFPEATEKQAWGDPTWRVRDRIFAMQKGNYDGGRPSVWCKAPAGWAGSAGGRGPGTVLRAAVCRAHGLGRVYLDGPEVGWDELAEIVEDSYRLIAPKRLVAELGGSAR